MTEDEIDQLVAEWHDAPESSPIARRELHEHLGMTWDEYRQWMDEKHL